MYYYYIYIENKEDMEDKLQKTLNIEMFFA